MASYSCSCSILQTHEDVVTEIFLYLPLRSLLRFRAVCKLWRDVIDSPFFRKLHILSNKEKEDNDETVYLQLNYDDSGVKASIKMINNNLNLIEFNEGFTSRMSVAQAKGLICFNLSVGRSAQPIVICNPFLGQTEILPLSPILTSFSSNSNSSHEIFRNVGIGCDGELYKVVELVEWGDHDRLDAHLYSRRTDSWRALGGLDQPMLICNSITLSCNDGHFAHWYAGAFPGRVILTFEMKNEVFRTIRISDFGLPLRSEGYIHQIVGKDDGCSFTLMIFPPRSRSDELVRIYKSSVSICEYEKGISRILSWNHVENLEHPLLQTTPTTPLPSWRRNCVILKTSDFVHQGRWKLMLEIWEA